MSIPKSVKDQQDYNNQNNPNFSPQEQDSIFFSQNPGVIIPAAIDRLRGQFGGLASKSNPFTQFLLSGNGLGGNSISTLYNLFGDPNTPPADYGSAINNFASSLVKSFYDPNAVAPVNLRDHNGAGQAIYDVLNRTVGSALGNSTEALGLADPSVAADASKVHDELGAIIDAYAPFSMGTLQAKIAHDQLDQLLVDYANSGAYKTTNSFGDYVLARAADWLQKWWHVTTGQRGADPTQMQNTSNIPTSGSVGGSASGGALSPEG